MGIKVSHVVVRVSVRVPSDPSPCFLDLHSDLGRRRLRLLLLMSSAQHVPRCPSLRFVFCITSDRSSRLLARIGRLALCRTRTSRRWPFLCLRLLPSCPLFYPHALSYVLSSFLSFCTALTSHALHTLFLVDQERGPRVGSSTGSGYVSPVGRWPSFPGSRPQLREPQLAFLKLRSTRSLPCFAKPSPT